MKFRIVEDCREDYPVRVICRALDVSASGYYAWRDRPESPRKAENRRLLGDIQRLYHEHRERYGSPRIHIALGEEGWTVSQDGWRASCVTMVSKPNGAGLFESAPRTVTTICPWPPTC
jgi:hypothetical protein